ncbi:MAG TPA: septal ring lytic transglycosylase RlpA family protein [Solirubrobacteraceae bacterium]|jgi:rare lipoprotein A (peptidoglycan hydrolase)|nr:septal ring lytic transglycosylase RlpA family protein [Solirubrobacteraceae bacterium]
MRLRSLTSLFALALLAALPGSAAAATGAGGASAPPTTPAVHASTAHRIHTTGIATWFGPGFYGQTTACGQTLTPAVVGVANRTLPCGTLIKVTYGGRALIVPVLDRGPYSHIGADWDLTSGAATALGITETVRIGTRIVGSAPNVPTLGLPAVPAANALAGGALAG